jgi:hypothetical protein
VKNELAKLPLEVRLHVEQLGPRSSARRSPQDSSEPDYAADLLPDLRVRIEEIVLAPDDEYCRGCCTQ